MFISKERLVFFSILIAVIVGGLFYYQYTLSKNRDERDIITQRCLIAEVAFYRKLASLEKEACNDRDYDKNSFSERLDFVKEIFDREYNRFEGAGFKIPYYLQDSKRNIHEVYSSL